MPAADLARARGLKAEPGQPSRRSGWSASRRSALPRTTVLSVSAERTACCCGHGGDGDGGDRDVMVVTVVIVEVTVVMVMVV